MKTWSCKIGEVDADRLPIGADFPMRRAIEKAYWEVTGQLPDFLFSGWGAELSEAERAVVRGQTPGRQPARGDDDMNANGYRVECQECGRVQMSGASPLKNGWPKCCGYTMRLLDNEAFIQAIDAEVGASFGNLPTVLAAAAKGEGETPA